VIAAEQKDRELIMARNTPDNGTQKAAKFRIHQRRLHTSSSLYAITNSVVSVRNPEDALTGMEASK